MTKTYIWSIIVIIALTSYLPRIIPLLLLKHYAIPEWFKKWLTFVPTAIFGALVLPDILLINNSLNLSFHNTALWATLLIAPIVLKTKSLGYSVILGAVAFSLLSFLKF